MHDFRLLTKILFVSVVAVSVFGIWSKLRFQKENQQSKNGLDKNGDDLSEKEYWFMDKLGFLLLVLVLMLAMCQIAQIIIFGGVL